MLRLDAPKQLGWPIYIEFAYPRVTRSLDAPKQLGCSPIYIEFAYPRVTRSLDAPKQLGCSPIYIEFAYPLGPRTPVPICIPHPCPPDPRPSRSRALTRASIVPPEYCAGVQRRSEPTMNMLTVLKVPCPVNMLCWPRLTQNS